MIKHFTNKIHEMTNKIHNEYDSLTIYLEILPKPLWVTELNGMALVFKMI